MSSTRRSVAFLVAVYIIDLICVTFLPSDRGTFDFSVDRGTADLFVCWIGRAAICASTCLLVYLKDTRVDAEPPSECEGRTEREGSGSVASGSVYAKSGVLDIQGESTPLLGDASTRTTTTTTARNNATTNDNIINNTDTAVAAAELVAVQLKDTDRLHRHWRRRADHSRLVAAAFGVAFAAHVTCNIFIAVKSLQYRYDNAPHSAFDHGGNATNATTTTTTTATVTSTATTATTTATTTPSHSGGGGNPASLFGSPTPPPVWCAALVSLCVLWCTVELFALHFYFSAVKGAYADECDVPAVPLIHPHSLLFEAETVLSKCNVCNMRFRERDRKFRCEGCDFFACGSCVDSRMQQWVGQLKAAERLREAAATATATPPTSPAAAAPSSSSPSTEAPKPPPQPHHHHHRPMQIIVGNADRVVVSAISKAELIKELFRITEGFRGILLLLISCTVAGVTIVVWIPKLQGHIIDAIVLRDLPDVKRTLVLFVALGLGRLALASTRTYATLIATRLATNSVRTRVFVSILNRDMSFFDATSSGVLQSRLTQDTSSMIAPLQTLVNQVLASVFQLVGATAMSFAVSWQLALLSFSVLGPIVYLTGAYANVSRVLNRQIGDSLADSTAVANEAFTNIRTVQSFGTEPFESRRYATAMHQTVAIARTNSVYSAGIMFINSSLDLVVWSLTLGFGGWIVLNRPDELSIGALITFQLYVNMLNMAYHSLSDAVNQLTKATGAAERVFTIIQRRSGDASVRSTADGGAGGDAPGSAAQPAPSSATNATTAGGGGDEAVVVVASARSPPQPHGSASADSSLSSSSCYIRLVNVHFTYPTRPAAPVLRGLSLDIRPGEMCALIGPSGSGKSTVVQLLLMFYRMQFGEIEIGHERRANRGAKAALPTVAAAADPDSPTATMGAARESTLTFSGDEDDAEFASRFDFTNLAQMDRSRWLRDVSEPGHATVQHHHPRQHRVRRRGRGRRRRRRRLPCDEGEQQQPPPPR